MSGDSLLSFNDASATSLASTFEQKAALVRAFIPDIRDSVTSAVGDWTGESRTACDAAIKRLEERGEELAELTGVCFSGHERNSECGQPCGSESVRLHR